MKHISISCKQPLRLLGGTTFAPFLEVMSRCDGYDFQVAQSGVGYRNQRVGLDRVSFAGILNSGYWYEELSLN